MKWIKQSLQVGSRLEGGWVTIVSLWDMQQYFCVSQRQGKILCLYATMCKKCFIIRIMRDISGAIRISECLIVTSEFHSYSQLSLNFTEECCYPVNSMSGLTHYFMPCWPRIFCKSVAEEEGSILKLIELGETWSCTYNHTVRNWQLHIVGYHRHNVSFLSINPNLEVSSSH